RQGMVARLLFVAMDDCLLVALGRCKQYPVYKRSVLLWRQMQSSYPDRLGLRQFPLNNYKLPVLHFWSAKCLRHPSFLQNHHLLLRRFVPLQGGVLLKCDYHIESRLCGLPKFFLCLRFSSRHQVQCRQKSDFPCAGLVQSSERDECAGAEENSRSIWKVTQATLADVAMSFLHLLNEIIHLAPFLPKRRCIHL